MVEQQKGTVAQLQEQVDDLQRRDNYHDGPNTPSSKNTMTRQQDRKIRRANRTPSKRKQGGQPGHRGTVRKVKIDREKVHALKECTRCGSGDLQEVWTKRRRITDIPPPPPAETVLHTITHYTCLSLIHI